MVGNCGDVPPGYLFMYWQCETVDNASGYTSEADYASVALASNGLAIIAYTENDDYYTINRLKVAYQVFNRVYLPVTTRP